MKTPYFMREIHCDEFANWSLSKDQISNIEKLNQGDIFILKSAFNQTDLRNLVQETHHLGKRQISSEKPTDYTNYNQIVSTNLDPKTGYSTLNRSFYFFRNNKSSESIFLLVDDIWKRINHIWGLPTSLYDNENYVERIQILFYPLNHGYLSTHSDGQTVQKLVIGIPLSEYGIQYSSGGLYFLCDKNAKCHVDYLTPLGSIILWYGSVFHGVDIPIGVSDNELNWDNILGRWMMLLNIIEPHTKKNRSTSKTPEQIFG